MTTEEAQEVLDELQNVRPEVLNDKAKRLFDAIMKIADTRDEALIENRKLKTMVDLMAEMINNQDIDEDICKQVILEKGECNEFEEKSVCIKCIKQYFENIAKEDKQ